MATKRLIYKIARFQVEAPGKSLQEIIERALKVTKAGDRQEESNSESAVRVINFHTNYRKFRVGELLDYTKGHVQPQADLTSEEEYFDLSSLPPEAGKEFVHSLLYFGIYGNHVIISQSMSLRVQQFEAHLNWFLSGHMDEGDYVILADHPPLARSAEVARTKGIQLTAPVSFEAVKASTSGTEIEEEKRLMVKPAGDAWEALKRILPDCVLPASLEFDEIIRTKSLEVKLLLSWKSLRKDDPTHLLDQISNELRHVDDEVDYTIFTKSGGRITKDEFKLSTSISVPTSEMGLPRRDELWPKMADWLEELISNGKVVPDP